MNNNKIKLDPYSEQVIFDTILAKPEKILALPKEYYDKFMNYVLQEGMYEHIPKLQSVKDKVVDKTLDELLEGATRLDIFD